MSATYLDSSALVKLAVQEAESDALRKHFRKRRRIWVSSALARTVMLRALIAGGQPATESARRAVTRCELVRSNAHPRGASTPHGGTLPI